MAIAIGASETWEFEALLLVTAATSTPDFKFAFTVPTGATIRWEATLVDGTTATPSGLITASGTSVALTVTGNNSDYVVVKGIVINSTTAGNLQLQWAQNSSNTTATKLQTGSFMKALKF
jgi:hypothetical protein